MQPLVRLAGPGERDGTVTLLAEATDSTRVIVTFPIPGTQGVRYPTTFHDGGCTNLGAVEVELPPHEDGVTQTVLDVPIEELRGTVLAVESVDRGKVLHCATLPAAAP